MSFTRPVGLHWLLAFMPLLAVLAAAALPPAALVPLVRGSAVLLLHGLLFIVLLALPVTTWRATGIYGASC